MQTPMFAALALAFALGAAATPSVARAQEDEVAAEDDASEEAAPAEEPEAEEPEVEAPTPRQAARAASDDNADYAAQLRMRADIMPVHRAFGIATWVSMLATVTLGMFQYYNLYGFFGGVEDTGCVRGDAIFGQEQCWGQPWVHRTAWITTTALYATTFTLSLTMPDPDHLDQGDSAYANNLRIHKALRWGHLAGMLAQVFLGLAISQNWFGIDRANDFGSLQALATVHQLVGLTTFGLVTAAGLMMIF